MGRAAGQVAPPADQFEMYNVTRDPAEIDNLYGNRTHAQTQALLVARLNEQRTTKRLSPTTQPWADGSSQQFPFQPTNS